MKDEGERGFKGCWKIQVVLDVRYVPRQVEQLNFHTNLKRKFSRWIEAIFCLRYLIEKDWKVLNEEGNFRLYCTHESNLVYKMKTTLLLLFQILLWIVFRVLRIHSTEMKYWNLSRVEALNRVPFLIQEKSLG